MADGRRTVCRACNTAAAVLWYKNNKPPPVVRVFQTPEQKKAIRRAQNLKWRASNKDKAFALQRKWNAANRDRVRAYQKAKAATDLNYRISRAMRSRVSIALKHGRGAKSASTIELLGCTVDFLRAHLQSLFASGMSWENYGRWHVDHRLPCASFDLTDPAQQRACFHFTNLQPMWAVDNQRKGARVPC